MPLNQAATNAFLTRAGKAAGDLDLNLTPELLEHAGCDPDTASLMTTAVEMVRALHEWSERFSGNGMPGTGQVSALLAANLPEEG